MKTIKWIIHVTVLYTIIGIIDLLTIQIPMEILQIGYFYVLSLPFWNKRVQGWLNTKSK